MKKITIILLTVFYFAVASGITVSLHYCGGKLKEVSLFHPVNEDGCCGNKKKSKGCCNEKTTFIKVKDNHKLSENVNLTLNYFKIVAGFTSTHSFNIPSERISYLKLHYHSPPVIYDNPLYLKHQVLLI